MESENVGPNENLSSISNEGELEATKGNKKRKNHRGGQKKKGKKGPNSGNQDTAAGSMEMDPIMEDEGDAGKGSNATQEVLVVSNFIDDTTLTSRPYQTQPSYMRSKQHPEKALVPSLCEISSAERESCASGR